MVNIRKYFFKGLGDEFPDLDDILIERMEESDVELWLEIFETTDEEVLDDPNNYN